MAGPKFLSIRFTIILIFQAIQKQVSMVLPTSFTLKPHFFKRALHLQRRTILQRGRCQRYAHYMLCIHFLMNSRFNSLGKNIIKEQRTYRSLGVRRGSKAIFTNHSTLYISVQGLSTMNISIRDRKSVV